MTPWEALKVLQREVAKGRAGEVTDIDHAGWDALRLLESRVLEHERRESDVRREAPDA